MSDSAKPLILSVDDDQDMQRLIERFLTGGGYDVITADRGEKALLLLDKIKPDLILLDVMMPEMDGYEFCAAVQKDNAKKFAFIPIVFLTALEEEQDKARAFASGAVDYLTKPTTKDKLLGMVEKHLKTKRQWMELKKAPSHVDIKKLYLDFTRFQGFLSDRLNLLPDKRKRLSNVGISQLYSMPDETGITNRQMARLIAEFLNLAYTPFIDPENIQMDTLPIPFCRRNLCLAIVGDPGKNTFVLANPFNQELLDLLTGYSKTDKGTTIVITEPENIELLLKYSSVTPIKPGMADDEKVQIVKSAEKPFEERKKEQDRQVSEWKLERHPVVYIANNLLFRATTERASDIHIEPKENDAVVRFRVDGDMRDIFTLQNKTSLMLISRLKVLANLDIAERRKPQDGAFEATIGSRSFKLRLATTSTPYGESLVMRLLEPTAKPKELKDLGMTDKQVSAMISFANRHQGFILIVGATGSGKTTTIYSLISHIDCKTRSLMSVEDPVEYTIPFANQQQVNVKAGVTFESLLKSSVRQDPDILYMGEMRDPESAKTAIDFASTGHLAVSTMHSANATTAVFRLERLGISRWIMADAVLGIVAQRLLKKLCPYCKKVAPISKEETEMLSPFTDDVPSKVAHPAGCPQCNDTGYLGREAVYEIMEFNREISEMVRSDTPIQEIRNFIRERGDYLMSDHAVEKVKKLIFSPKDAYEKVLVEDRGFGKREPVKEGQKGDLAGKKVGVQFIEPVLTEGLINQTPTETKITNFQQSYVKTSILVVEDNEDTQKLAARYLENEGYEVTVAGDGIEALLSLGSKRFNLILSDIDMPNLDGLKLLEMKNQKGIETPVVFLTARTDEESELKGFELGAADYIKKPIQKEVLLLRIKKALKSP
ncbi:MAG: Flp pilus assembly complex ATPase component TadA [Deltaproteobacteria bacterium]|nr:Flp pilus assembly complex ATPase component TadA [Deltaproteobacteria bacterium]